VIKEDSIETQDNHSYVYLLLSTDGDKFKIGKADDVYSRYSTLKKYWGEIDFNKSMQIRCNKKQVHSLEKTLHFIFDNYNIDMQSNADGHTEWFDSDCFEDATNLLDHLLQHKSHKTVQLIEGIELPPKPVNKECGWNTRTKEENIREREQKWNVEAKEAEIKNFQAAKAVVNWFKIREGNLADVHPHLEYEGYLEVCFICEKGDLNFKTEALLELHDYSCVFTSYHKRYISCWNFIGATRRNTTSKNENHITVSIIEEHLYKDQIEKVSKETFRLLHNLIEHLKRATH